MNAPQRCVLKFILVLGVLVTADAVICFDGQWYVIRNGTLTISEKFCCRSRNNRTVTGDPRKHESCCENATSPIFDKRTHLCNGTVITSKTDDLEQCGYNLVIDRQNQRCKRVSTNVWEALPLGLTDTESCTGDQLHVFRNGKSELSESFCCRSRSNQIYIGDPREHKSCCENAKYPLYDKRTHLCDGTEIIPKTVHMEQCGYNLVVDKRNQRCKEVSTNKFEVVPLDVKYYIFELNARGRKRRSSHCKEIQGTLIYGDESKSIQLILPSCKGCLKVRRKITWYLVFSIVEWKDITDSLNVEKASFAPVRVMRKLVQRIKKNQSKQH